MRKPEPFLDCKLVLGEGPFWDEKHNTLWLIDGLSQDGKGDDLYMIDPVTKSTRVYHIGKHIGCAVPTESGEVLLNLQDGIWLFDPKTERLSEISDLEREIENNRLNDGKCDSRGRLWFGSMSMTANQPEREFEVAGSFYKLEADGAVTKFFEGVGISNGMAWNADETVFYYVDTTTQSVFSFDFDVVSGVISNRKAIITIPIEEGSPDGMCIDAEGMLWIAHFGGWKVSRWNPNTKEKIDEIPLPCAQVTCPAFGGEDLSELYITTAYIGLSPEELEKQPLAGTVFRCKVGVKGTKANYYVGGPKNESLG